jgi:cytochrome oxidase Cu insertion factor (SCO1/SenC/PrrC family)
MRFGGRAWLVPLTLVIAVTAAAAAAWHWRSGAAVEPTTGYGRVPDFALVDRTGRTVTRRDFLGKISVVDFFYTRCTDACPLQSAQMRVLQNRYGGRGLQLVSITVDPAHDDRATLAAYARSIGADPRWLFLTGRRDDIYRLAVDGFHLAAVATSESRFPGPWAFWQPPLALAHELVNEPRIIQLTHASQFAVVDRQARIAGYFDSFDSEQRQELRDRLDHWLR